ncbi:MAG TPA: NAD(P)/FAD-dependent oxidoreductase [Solirubrobacteraceae bacterium]|nr:NAD(P)/FAD-dependent oxidoreductase [Solirubrobacteraceae bacterium]
MSGPGRHEGLDAVVVGSGPNGLAAAVTLARAGLRVEVHEGAAATGGGCRTEELTLPGFSHDVCSTVHPLLAASPFFRERLPDGVRLLTPDVAFAHPLDGGTAAFVSGSVGETADSLLADGTAYRRLLGPLVERWESIVPSVLAPMLAVPRHPLAMARFGLPGLAPASVLASGFRTAPGRALLAGLAAHSMRPLRSPGTGAFALLLGMLAHAVGWPVVEGGSQAIADGLLAELRELGGTVQTGTFVEDLAQLPPARATLLNLTPRQLLAMSGPSLPDRYRAGLSRFRYGPGICKVDWALSGPVPWSAPECRRTATVHLGGTFEEIAHGESEVAAGRHPERPFCIAVQPTVLDPGRAPAGSHTFYAYCHVPSGSRVDMADRIEAQVERFAPGFREMVLDRAVVTAEEVEAHNPNYIGGDINAGAATLRQTLFRPVLSTSPYSTPLPGVYLCSASTPPGGGVHGMCGVGAATAALKDLGVA